MGQHTSDLRAASARPERYSPKLAAGDNAVSSDDPREVLLQRIFARHCLLDLRFARGTVAYQTAIIELVPEQGYLVLDALTPIEGNAHMIEMPLISLRTLIDGAEAKFDARVTQCGGDDDSPYYKALYPETIESPQRRREYRVTIPLDRGVAMHFNGQDGFSLVGEVRDLSPSGFSARLNGGSLDQLARADGLQGECQIEFVDGGRIQATIEICHIFPSRGRTAPRIGACFVELDASTERALERYVARLDRERARAR